MFSVQARLKLLAKIAQQATSQPSSPATTAPATTLPPAPAFSPISGPWAFLAQAYNSPTIQYLARLLGILNTAMYYASNGQHSLQKNQNDLGNVDASSLPSVDAKNIVLLAKLVYATFINSGHPFPQAPNARQIATWAGTIAQSQPLLNLSQLNQTGPLSQQLNANFQLDGSLRQNILNLLGYMTASNSQQSAQRR